VPTPTGEPAALARAIQQTTRVLGERSDILRDLRYAANFQGSDSLFRRIGSASDKNAIFDCLAEIRFAWAFEDTGRQPEFVRPRKTARGPDLLVFGDGHSAWVEVTRLQSAEADAPDSLPDGELEFDLEDSEPHIRKFYEVIASKIAQIEEGCGSNNAILAIWSNHDDREDLEFRAAVQQIRCEAEEGLRRVPSGLLFAVLRAPLRNVSHDQLVYCEPFQELQEPFTKWAKDLETLGRTRE
jgi:hypothetical protein